MVGIAVLGCGRIGRIHARNLARHPRARLLMVFDVLAEAAQQTATELGVKIARSVDEVLSAGNVHAREMRFVPTSFCVLRPRRLLPQSIAWVLR